ncbi:MAG: glycosyltransferase family 1 protein [Ilumatobacter fluminis]|uniref:glycosyltransferase family 4 protein n=1 Tax=Ilumatobacter fluminis TaxID=467091 RepID=UPI0032EFFFFD
MKVAIDAGPLYGHRTGVGMAAAGMIDAIARLDDVDLVPYLVSGRSTPEPGHRRLPLPGIVASHVWSRADAPKADRWLDGADLVHGTNYVAPATAMPAVVSVYDCWFLRHPEQASALVRRAGANLRRAVRRGAWIHASSDVTADAVRDLLDTDRVRTVLLGPPPTPADIEPLPVDRLRGARYVIAIGTEERRKGLPLLVEAFALLREQHPELRLVLVGAPGDDSDAVDAAIERLGVADGVDRMGPVDDASKLWLLRNAAALAYPSIDEGFGFPVLEAQAAGTPVVATAVGSIPEVAGTGAVLVDDPTRSASVFADAIVEAIDGHGRLALLEAGYRNVRRFDWDTTAAGVVDLYETAVGGSS